ncbi:sodium-dependent nutrient amino acid transporter 1-like [Athalia rosae]|uniref:sodium-dependent nutrient amino acid transporter 1-like n=1 Tax=Athalia rosae TaxID=37344 RepID=UPI0020334BED|nr:sodium-dependent nutrient amino acid transporter 1-like [Athalia rosae]
MDGTTNFSFENDQATGFDAVEKSGGNDGKFSQPIPDGDDPVARGDGQSAGAEKRATWGNSVEFVMSCIALSIGFGNVWRFPFTAYENGGGAFLIPYVIVLLFIGKPFYYLEMIVGQFCSSTHLKAWRISPGFKGVGWAQTFSLTILATYYCSLMALNLFYLFASFSSELPWAYCRDEWGDDCVDSGSGRSNFTWTNETTNRRSSAELYFTKEVLKEVDDVDEGIGLPDWRLTLCLLASWLTICGVLSRGVKSTGKASYFLALFPYVIMIALLIRALTLEGAMKGVLFFVSPNWIKIIDPQVWYAAITQCFFSLSICFGSIIMYSSHNEFRHNIYRDALIVTTLDTFTSMMAGCTIFGILGNLAHEMNVEITTVVRGGTGLAFISYPDAIAKFKVVPQLFGVLFFTMMFVLGVGSGAGMSSGIITGVCDQFPKLKRWQVVVATAVGGFCVGTIYVTPGGQFVLTLVDHYGASFIVYIVATCEIIGIMWVYGLENVIDDVEFMLKSRPGVYWRFCWCVLIPVVLIAVFVYVMIDMEPLTYGNVEYPSVAHAFGWTLAVLGVSQVPIWMIFAILKHKRLPFSAMLAEAFRPADTWGPRLRHDRRDWLTFKEEKSSQRRHERGHWLARKLRLLFNVGENKTEDSK